MKTLRFLSEHGRLDANVVSLTDSTMQRLHIIPLPFSFLSQHFILLQPACCLTHKRFCKDIERRVTSLCFQSSRTYPVTNGLNSHHKGQTMQRRKKAQLRTDEIMYDSANAFSQQTNSSAICNFKRRSHIYVCQQHGDLCHKIHTSR